jgi:Laminin G domain
MSPPVTDRPGRRVAGGARGWTRVVVTTLVLLGTAGCGLLPGGDSRGHATSVTGEGEHSLTLSHAVVTGLELSGDDLSVTGPEAAPATVSVDAGGVLRSATGPDGGPALRFPTYQATETPPVAIVAISSDDPDWLQPREGPLVFGVDVELDATSSGTHRDNGDNLVQRGLFTSASQFKLQADKRHPSCLIRGDAGSVFVVSPVTLEAGQWYRLACRRDGDQVELTVSPLRDGRPVDPTRTTGEGPIGSVSFPPATRLSVGGKLADGDRPAAATDQFNGSLSHVFVDVDDDT